MLHIKQILVPIDFSPASWPAVENASALAHSYEATVDLLHVWELPLLADPEGVASDSRLPASVVDVVREHAQRALDRFATRARERGCSIRKAENVPGNPRKVIVEHAERGGYDLIVVGTHGRTGLGRAVLGSVAEKVVRHAACPVLVARADLS